LYLAQPVLLRHVADRIHQIYQRFQIQTQRDSKSTQRFPSNTRAHTMRGG
jgi:hypothetical protein